ncbi:hypothetical protein [Flagellimonas okinawensis]|uniref:Uncharacterized protein n=1 Tax=Flagellimonas okinawensis TaxID=3031324 RepID=A0ABT5XPJ5_9FLAO|nr:hypothetical protein [[Muricauda] okinawensis]MDF0707814.1 hypothetical protein [[Muricauda] okinawensis]
MRLKVHITLFFTLALAAMGMAQEGKDSFFRKQALKDAIREQSATYATLEDEKDFWQDQNQYEKDLESKDKDSYTVYMNAKRSAYSEHAELCGDHCTHSDFYYEQASYYFTYIGDKNFTKEAIAGSIVQVASPRSF